MTATRIEDEYWSGTIGLSARNGPVLTFKTEINSMVQWNVVSSLIEVEAGEYHMKFDVECGPRFLHESNYYQSRDWYCDAKFKLKLSDDNFIFTEYELDYQFNKNSPMCEIGKFFGTRYFEYTAKVKIKSMSGFDQPISEFSCPNIIDSEIVLRTGIHKLYVNKYPLLFCSSVLRELISAEKNGTNIIDVVKACSGLEFDIEHVVNFIRLLYGKQLDLKETTYNHVVCILKLATKYDVQFLISNLEDFLIAHEFNNVSNALKMLIAEELKLPKLQLETMKKLKINDIEETIRLIRYSFKYKQGQTAKLLLVHLCKFLDGDDDVSRKNDALLMNRKRHLN